MIARLPRESSPAFAGRFSRSYFPVVARSVTLASLAVLSGPRLPSYTRQLATTCSACEGRADANDGGDAPGSGSSRGLTPIKILEKRADLSSDMLQKVTVTIRAASLELNDSSLSSRERLEELVAAAAWLSSDAGAQSMRRAGTTPLLQLLSHLGCAYAGCLQSVDDRAPVAYHGASTAVAGDAVMLGAIERAAAMLAARGSAAEASATDARECLGAMASLVNSFFVPRLAGSSDSELIARAGERLALPATWFEVSDEWQVGMEPAAAILAQHLLLPACRLLAALQSKPGRRNTSADLLEDVGASRTSSSSRWVETDGSVYATLPMCLGFARLLKGAGISTRAGPRRDGAGTTGRPNSNHPLISRSIIVAPELKGAALRGAVDEVSHAASFLLRRISVGAAAEPEGDAKSNRSQSSARTRPLRGGSAEKWSSLRRNEISPLLLRQLQLCIHTLQVAAMLDPPAAQQLATPLGTLAVGLVRLLSRDRSVASASSSGAARAQLIPRPGEPGSFEPPLYSALVDALDRPSRVRLIRCIAQAHAKARYSNPALFAVLTPLLSQAVAPTTGPVGMHDAKSLSIEEELQLAADAVTTFRHMTGSLSGGFEGGTLPAYLMRYLHDLMRRTASTGSSAAVEAASTADRADAVSSATASRHDRALRIATEFLSAACKFGYFAAGETDIAGTTVAALGAASTAGRSSAGAAASVATLSSGQPELAGRAPHTLTAEALSSFFRDTLRSFDASVERWVPRWAETAVGDGGKAASNNAGVNAAHSCFPITPAPASAPALAAPQRPLRFFKTELLQGAALLHYAAEAGVPLALGDTGKTTLAAALTAALQLRDAGSSGRVSPAAAAALIMQCLYSDGSVSAAEKSAARQLALLMRHLHSVLLREFALSHADSSAKAAIGGDHHDALRVPLWIRPIILEVIRAQEALYSGKASKEDGADVQRQAGNSSHAPVGSAAASSPEKLLQQQTPEKPASSLFAQCVASVIGDVCKRRGLPQPGTEVHVPELGVTLDIAWPQPGLKVAVEVDGPSHYAPRSFAEQAAQLAEYEGVSWSLASPAAQPQVFKPRRIAEMGAVQASHTVRPATLLRTAALQACGWHVVRVSCHDVYVRPIHGAAQGNGGSGGKTATVSQSSDAGGSGAGGVTLAGEAVAQMPSWAAWTRPAGGRIVHRVLEDGGVWKRLADFAASNGKSSSASHVQGQ